VYVYMANLRAWQNRYEIERHVIKQIYAWLYFMGLDIGLAGRCRFVWWDLVYL
jgi:hypothetical protein